jgi:hypothetical protein
LPRIEDLQHKSCGKEMVGQPKRQNKNRKNQLFFFFFKRQCPEVFASKRKNETQFVPIQPARKNKKENKTILKKEKEGDMREG